MALFFIENENGTIRKFFIDNKGDIKGQCESYYKVNQNSLMPNNYYMFSDLKSKNMFNKNKRIFKLVKEVIKQKLN